MQATAAKSFDSVNEARYSSQPIVMAFCGGRPRQVARFLLRKTDETGCSC